ncbi:MAG TPA: hypothetical protein VFM30_11595 [Steroidobacteraceae bacterium]|jgi:hypothetical protein|nr:hypothetical protein [Steroidobacteraceae bacterium]
MTSRFRPVFGLGAAALAVGALLRVALWREFGLLQGVGLGELPSIMLRGLANDAVVTLYGLSPLVLYLALVTERWLQTRPHRLLLMGGSWLTLFAMVYLAVVERYFFQEFDARFNLVAFDYLAYPTEVAGDIWTEYPVVWIAICAGVAATLGLACLRRWLPRRKGP